MSACLRRLQRELAAIEKEQRAAGKSTAGSSASTSSSTSTSASTSSGDILRLAPVSDQQLHHWRAEIAGPADSPYEGGRFVLDIRVPADYPIQAPTVTFVTRVFHPNVLFRTGEICLDVLKSNWSPMWSLQSVCRAVVALLGEPEASSPLNCDAGNMIRAGDMRGFRSMARMYTQMYAAAANKQQ